MHIRWYIYIPACVAWGAFTCLYVRSKSQKKRGREGGEKQKSFNSTFIIIQWSLIGVHRESWRTYMPPWPRKEEFLEVQLDTSVKGPWQRASSAHFSESVKKGWAPIAQSHEWNLWKFYISLQFVVVYISMSSMFAAASWILCPVQLNSISRWVKNFCQMLIRSFLCVVKDKSGVWVVLISSSSIDKICCSMM